MGIEWRNSLAIGVEEIDNQHKELIIRFNRLLSACEGGKGVAELRELLLFLDDYVVKHFTDEEILQRRYKYPEYEEHKKLHDSFIGQIKELKQEINSEGVSLHHVVETNNMLLKWLINHISKVDTNLGKFLRSVTPS